MKTIFHFKSILGPSLFFVGILFLVTSCTDKKTIDSREIAQQENIDRMTADDREIVVIKNDHDTKFLIDAAEMQLEEIQLGKLAQQKGNSPKVKELGKMMEESHTKSLAELKTLAKSKSVAIPTSITEDSKEAHDKLNQKAGRDFDKEYSKMVVNHHEDAIKSFESASTESEDREIRAWATSKLAILNTHLQQAESCKEEMEKEKSKS